MSFIPCDVGWVLITDRNAENLDVLSLPSNHWHMNLNQTNNGHVRKNCSRVAMRRSRHLFVCAMRNTDRAM